ncbi:hypothetical protein BGZ60DRAFT_511337 [Tricladium varicosporioides]|nr:hypothetical protein BGZ60DRAFT_511337 [Hymenoscyphus varicosporioides]
MQFPVSLLSVLSLAAFAAAAPTPDEIPPGHSMGQFVEYKYPKCHEATQYTHVISYAETGKCLKLRYESMGVDFSYAEKGCALYMFKDENCNEEFIHLIATSEGCFSTGVDSWKSVKLIC